MTWRELRGNRQALAELVQRYGGYAPAAKAIGVPYATLRDECYRLGIPSPNVPGQRASSTARTVSLEAPPSRVRVERDGDAEVFIIDGVSYWIDRELKRRIYELYSSEGAGATLSEVEMETGIPRAALEAIKSYWGLVHASPIWPDEDLAERPIDELVEEGLAKRKQAYRRRLRAREAQWFERAWRKEAARARLEERLIEELRHLLPQLPPPATRPPRRRGASSRRLYLGLTDWHVGKRTLDRELIASPGMSTEILRRRVELLQDGLHDLLQDLARRPQEIIVVLHGDMLDDPLAQTYPRQDRGQDLQGYRQLVEAVNLLHGFLAFCAGLAPELHIRAIRGNHSTDWDLVAAHWAAERLRGWEGVSVHVDERPMTSIVRGRNQFIALHGDRLRGGRTTRELDILQAIMMLGQPGYRHYVTFGHLHHREALNALLKESTGYEWYLLPSMVGGDEYSETLFATSRPAQMALLVDDELGVLAPWTIYVDTPEIQEGISA